MLVAVETLTDVVVLQIVLGTMEVLLFMQYKMKTCYLELVCNRIFYPNVTLTESYPYDMPRRFDVPHYGGVYSSFQFGQHYGGVTMDWNDVGHHGLMINNVQVGTRVAWHGQSSVGSHGPKFFTKLRARVHIKIIKFFICLRMSLGLRCSVIMRRLKLLLLRLKKI